MMVAIMAVVTEDTVHPHLPVIILTIGALIIGITIIMDTITILDLTTGDMTGTGLTIVGDLTTGDLMVEEWNAGDQIVAAGWNAATWATGKVRVWNGGAPLTEEWNAGA